jgi:hypothetical protein
MIYSKIIARKITEKRTNRSHKVAQHTLMMPFLLIRERRKSE